MEYLNDSQIIEQVFYYLNEDIYNYAIMLNGAWGSGKTYFVKEILLPQLKKQGIERKPIYLSLYGLKSNDEIAAAMLTSIIELRMGKMKKMLPILRGGANILTDFFGAKVESDTVKNLDESILSPFILYGEYYFIFDDLERCSMPINETLGYINNFIEQNNAKVILVAYEEEIGSVEFYEQKLMRYLIATQDTIQWPKQEKPDPFGIRQKTSDTQSKPTLEDIEYRMELLAEENQFYFQVKEKLVGQTIYYQPVLESIVPALFSKCLSNQDKSIFLPCVETANTIMVSENHYNIRTLQFSLSFLAKILKAFPCSSIGAISRAIYNDMIVQVFTSIMKVSIHYKKGLKKYEWSENSEFGLINLSEKYSYFNYFTSFKFIHDYVYYGNYNLEHTNHILNKYLNELAYKEEKLNDPVNVLSSGYWEMDDDEIESNLVALYNNLEERKYKAASYRYILSLLYKLKGIGFEPIQINQYMKIMESVISQGDRLETLQEPCISKDDPYVNDYYASLEKLKSLSSTSSQQEQSNSINTLFDKEKGWGKDFIDYCRNARQQGLISHGFFKHISIDICLNAIKKSSVQDISNFRRAIYPIYDFSNIKDFYSDDLENIKTLVSKLNFEVDSKMKQFNIKLLQENLESIIERLEEK